MDNEIKTVEDLDKKETPAEENKEQDTETYESKYNKLLEEHKKVQEERNKIQEKYNKALEENNRLFNRLTGTAPEPQHKDSLAQLLNIKGVK